MKINRQISVFTDVKAYLANCKLLCMGKKTKRKEDSILFESSVSVPEYKKRSKKTAWDVAKEWQDLGKGKVDKLKSEEISAT